MPPDAAERTPNETPKRPTAMAQSDPHARKPPDYFRNF